ncbi:MAG: hypothetical protein WBV80_26475 [Mycobacterium sp.]
MLAATSVAVLFGGLAIGVALGGVMPLPYGSVAAIHAYVQTQSSALRVIAVTAFGSSVPLAVYAAMASARLRRLGVESAAPTVALAGGILAAGALGLTGLLGWTLSRMEITGDIPLVRSLYLMAFLVGGPGHIVALGVLLGGIAAGGLVPRPLARVGVAVAALCESATLVLAWPVLGPMLPVARVSALVWLVVAGARLDRDPT